MLMDVKACVGIHDQKTYKSLVITHHVDGQDNRWTLIKGML